MVAVWTNHTFSLPLLRHKRCLWVNIRNKKRKVDVCVDPQEILLGAVELRSTGAVR